MNRVFALSLLVLSGCPACQAPADDTGSHEPIAIEGFALGVEYTQLGLEDTYASAGVPWAKTRLEAFEWGESEPSAPVGGTHTYDWTCPDALIVDWQQAGVTHIQSYLSPKSPWGSVDAAGLVAGDIAPAPEHVEDLRAWVHALIERYDGDGVDDAPGLVTGVHDWVVGPEWTGFWPSGDHEAYIAFAEVVADEARAADPDVRLGSMPFFFADEFAGNEPTDAEIEAAMGAPYTLRNDNEGVAAILDRPDLFDSISVHALGDYTEVPPTVAWLRAEMADRGYDLPIWFDDAFPAGVLANGASYPTNYPVTSDSYDDVYALLRALGRDEEVGGYTPEDARAWVLAYYGAHTIKKVVTTLGEGVSGIMLGNSEDWLADDGAAIRDGQVFLLGGSATMGMLDVDHPAGYDLCAEREAGPPRPAFTNLALLLQFLEGDSFDAVERLGGTEGARGYRLERGGVSSWVLWSEDGQLHLPGDPAEEPVTYALAVPEGVTSVTVTTAVTVEGGEPSSEAVAVEGGQVVLALTSTPVLVAVE